MILLIIKRVTVFLLLANVVLQLFAGTEYYRYLKYAVALIVMLMIVVPLQQNNGWQQDWGHLVENFWSDGE